MELSLSDSQPCCSKWDESQSKRSGHCCSIDYQWKMSDSLSQVSLVPPHTQPNCTLLIVWTHLQSDCGVGNVYAQALKRNHSTARKGYTVHCDSFKTHFPICSGSALQWPFVEHTVSFIGRTLNLKAWWGVYWSPDPVFHSLNWFMDSISGAQAAGVRVGVRTRLTGIHHTDQVSSAASPCGALARPLQMLLPYSPAWPKAGLYASTYIHAHTHLQRLADIHKMQKTHRHPLKPRASFSFY